MVVINKKLRSMGINWESAQSKFNAKSVMIIIGFLLIVIDFFT